MNKEILLPCGHDINCFYGFNRTWENRWNTNGWPPNAYSFSRHLKINITTHKDTIIECNMSWCDKAYSLKEIMTCNE